MSLPLLLGLLLLQPTRAATLVYTNDVLGELEPCGCRNNPAGGMVRKNSLLERHEDKELLQLDAGDLLFETEVLPQALTAQAELQAAYLLQAHDRLGHDAAVPGEKDFALGVRKFEKLIKKSKIAFLAANLVRAKGGAPLLKPHAIFTRKDAKGKKLRIAVLGLVGSDLRWPAELKALSPIAAARKALPALRGKADLVIALTHQGFDKDVELAKAVPGIDVIVGGHSQTFLQEPHRQGKTLIYQSSFRNQYVGLVPLTLPFTGEQHRLVPLDAGFDPPEGAPATSGPKQMAALVAEMKAKIAELNTAEDAKMVLTSLPADGGHAAKYQTFPRCAECHLKQYDFWRKTPHARALQPLVDAGQAKNKQCLQCHTLGLGEREGFSHVDRLAERKAPPRPQASPSPSVPEDGLAFSPEPDPEGKTENLALEDLTAYLTAVHKAGKLEDEVRLVRTEAPKPIQQTLTSLIRSWTPVQCENCHQPGRDHPFSGTYSKIVNKEACFNCHTAERAPGWYKSGKPDLELIAQKRTLMTCPKGEFEPATN